MPFQRAWENIALSEMDGEELEYFWLLSRLTSKIISCVRAAGGSPLALTPTEDEREIEDLALKLDGFVFAGGQDIAPSFYEEESCGSHAPDVARDNFETSLCRAALAHNKPLLGVCRGCQLLNVVLGGTLVQDLPSLDEKLKLHSRSDVTRGYVHDVKILAPRLFPNHEGETMRVNSMHHQAIGRLSNHLKAAAETEDGIVEAVFAPEYRWAVALQWHPECLALDDSIQMDIFRMLVEKAGTQDSLTVPAYKES